MYCRKCGSRIDDEAVICPKCGVATPNFDKRVSGGGEKPSHVTINNNNVSVNRNGGLGFGRSSKSKTVALLFAIFLGWMGMHRFYVGKVGTGIIYLCTFGFFGIGWILDICSIVIGTFRDTWGLPLRWL